MGSLHVLDVSKTVIEYLARCIEFAAALIIAIAAARATWQSMRLLFTTDAPAEAKVAVRLTLGRWLAVALEFELAADVLNTAVTPTWGDIEKTGRHRRTSNRVELLPGAGDTTGIRAEIATSRSGCAKHNASRQLAACGAQLAH